MPDERHRLDDASSWYLSEQLDFDKRLIHFRYLTLRPFIQGPEGLELGPAEGQMTRFLISDFERLTVVEGAQDLLDRIPDSPRLVKVRSLFEDFTPLRLFDTIVMEHILEHVDDPVALLGRVAHWLSPGGILWAGVPNALSIHRLVAVKMGLLAVPWELNARDIAQGHRRVYTPELFRRDIEMSGLTVERIGGVYFKPVSTKQIQNTWTDAMIQGFYELGKDFEHNAADMFAICRRK